MMDLFDIDESQKQNDEAKAKKNRIKELESLITKYQKSYYDGEGEISDAEFDKLWDELKVLDPENSILHKVGADNSANFEKVRHIMPMGSQEKAADNEQFMAWALKHDYSEYLVEYKLDGASLELQYENGNLMKAVTRGDGSTGDDITRNALKMKGVIKTLCRNGQKVDFTGGIRGEVIMTHQVHQSYFSDKANCRNAANGLMKRKDGSGSEYLTLITYDVWATEGEQPYSDEEDKLKFLSDCGFNPVVLKVCNSAQEVIDYRIQIMEKRKSLEYDIDGLVIKERSVNHQDAMRDRPDRQIAFKFNLEEAVSILRQVEWGENGATYTPVAVFDKVDLNGTQVQRASLANPNLIRALNLKIGSHVVVVKRGEIIPKIMSVLHTDSSDDKLEPIIFPSKCAVCGSELVDEGTRLYCPNKSCPKRVLHQLLKWVSVLDIRDFGETLITALYNKGVLKSITDIYSLTVENLTPYFLTEKSMSEEKKSLGAQKVYDSIQNHRQVTLEKFIAGFDIEGIGETIVEKVVQSGYETIDKIFELSEEQVAGIYGFAEIMAHTFVQGMKENFLEMKNLIDNKIITIKVPENNAALSGKSFCFTGELHSMKRSDAQAIVKEKGGSVKSSVVKGLSYLVTNDTSSGSSKNLKAKELGIPVINEEEFLALIKG
jgi:DNA ligase (NAD+)